MRSLRLGELIVNELATNNKTNNIVDTVAS